MKNLIMILIAFATMQASAQEQKRDLKKQRMATKMDYSPEQMAELQTKKLTLNLDLNEKQQKEISAIYLDNAKLKKGQKEAYLQAKEKDENKSVSKEKRFKMANARLDQQIEMKRKMKGILSSEQYEKWDQMKEKSGHKSKKHHKRSQHRKDAVPKQKTNQ
ncbi:hypothetical protein [Gelidibacter mesophilus]|uniref:hypothetical protein n=1 Tax=Gelidibacter mesophilus TaxID=169050 RepID=UPI0006859F8B|nr:hypothetical protein [Gelidibacter mesophilus]